MVEIRNLFKTYFSGPVEVFPPETVPPLGKGVEPEAVCRLATQNWRDVVREQREPLLKGLRSVVEGERSEFSKNTIRVAGRVRKAGFSLDAACSIWSEKGQLPEQELEFMGCLGDVRDTRLNDASKKERREKAKKAVVLLERYDPRETPNPRSADRGVVRKRARELVEGMVVNTTPDALPRKTQHELRRKVRTLGYAHGLRAAVTQDPNSAEASVYLDRESRVLGRLRDHTTGPEVEIPSDTRRGLRRFIEAIKE